MPCSSARATLPLAHRHAASDGSVDRGWSSPAGCPSAGRTRVFVEFYRADQLHVAAYTVEAKR